MKKKNELIMHGDRESEVLSEYTYYFTNGEMHEILKAVNHRPYNRANMIDLLLNGKKKTERMLI
jgi:hypothetical protein